VGSNAIVLNTGLQITHWDIHLALIQRAPNGTPNTGEHLECVSSMHASLLDFSQWWIKEYA
jgi:hypothetical protein